MKISKKPAILLLIFLICVSVFSFFIWKYNLNSATYKGQDYVVLVITNYSYKNKPKGYNLRKINKKAQNKIERFVKQNLKNVKIIWIDYPEEARKKSSPKGQKLYKQFRKKLQTIIKKYKSRLILVVNGTISKTAQDTLDIIPPEIPVWTGASSKDANSKFKGKEIFSTAASPFYSKAYFILKAIELLNLKGIVFILSDQQKDSPYSYSIKEALEKSNDIKNHKISLITVKKSSFEKEEKFILQNNNLKNYLWVLGIGDSSNAMYEFYKNYLEGRKLNVMFIYFSSSLYDKEFANEDNIFFISSHLNRKNPFDYSYLGGKVLSLCNYNIKCVHSYDYNWRNFFNRISIILDKKISSLIKSQKSVTEIRTVIRKKIKKSSLYHPFVDKITQEIYVAYPYNTKKGLTIYYNGIYPWLVNRYLIKVKNNKRELFEKQVICLYVDPSNRYECNKVVPVVYIEPFIRKINILSLSTDKAVIEMVVKLRYLKTSNNNFEIGKNIDISTSVEFVGERSISQISAREYKDYIEKLYDVRLIAPVRGNLFSFPFNKAWIDIEFFPKNFKENPFLIQILSSYEPFESQNISSNWKITNWFSSSSKKVLISENIPYIGYRYYFSIQLERLNPYQILFKYFAPALIITLVGLIAAYYIIRYGRSHIDFIDILNGVILGIISIYFIFSLLVSISNLIFMDVVFFILVLFMSIILVYAIFRLK